MKNWLGLYRPLLSRPRPDCHPGGLPAGGRTCSECLHPPFGINTLLLPFHPRVSDRFHPKHAGKGIMGNIVQLS